MKLTYILVVLFSLTLNLFGQEPSKEYDKFENYTSVSTPKLTLKSRDEALGLADYLEFRAFFVHDGEIQKQPPRLYVLHFISNTEKWQFLSSRKLIFIIDGSERLDLGEAKRDSSIHSRSVSEFLSVTTTATQFSKIAKAKKIEMRLGTFETELSADDLLALSYLHDAGTMSKTGATRVKPKASPSIIY